MSTLAYFRAQAVIQQAAADAAKLEKMRSRHREAADSWTVFADGLERRVALRIRLARTRALNEPSENPDRGLASR